MTTEVAVIPNNEIATQQTVLSLAQVKEQMQRMHQIMNEVMKEGEHYGAVPGCGNRKVLLKPGAEILGLVFRLRPEFALHEENLPNGHYYVRVTTTLHHIVNGQIYGAGEGSGSTMETKFRYRNSSKKCPICGKETIIPGKKEYGGGWLCYKNKGGCGAKWPAGAKEIEGQKTGKVEYENPYDYRNTVLKMAIKRSHVAAIIYATAAGDIFTQDLDDMEGIIETSAANKSATNETKNNESKLTNEEIKTIMNNYLSYVDTVTTWDELKQMWTEADVWAKEEKNKGELSIEDFTTFSNQLKSACADKRKKMGV